ncbi:MAG: cupredoxin domain-containing protein [Nitrososphaerota archaeon]
MSQDASAQLAANKAFSLTGSGFAVSKDSIEDASIDLLFVPTKTKTNIDFGFQSGTLLIGDKDLTVSDFSGSILQDGKFFRVSSTASTDEDQFTIKALGRLVDKTATDSIYSLTGTMTDSKKATTKFVYTTKISEFTSKTVEAATKSTVTIKILKGAANPNESTYIEQTAGFQFNYFSEDRITINRGGTITFVNEDTASHSLKSGTSNNWSKQRLKDSFTADGKVSSGDIQPGKSWSVTIKEPGFYRIFDENYQWMDVTIYVMSDTNSKIIGSTIKPQN